MEIIGRNYELKELKSCLESKKPEFIVVYGRRRVGKTYLIKNFFNNKFSFYVSGVNNKSTKIQLNNFKNSLNEYGLDYKKGIKDWLEAFKLLKQLLEDKTVYSEASSNKRIVFIDEMPWLDSKKSDFKAGLDLFWNTYGSTQTDLILIVCGSATSWIINNMVKDMGGFYNRLTRKLHLLPFSLNECLEYSTYLNLNYTKKQIIDCYMVFGGVPYYWDLLKPGFSIAQNIDSLCFSENGQLHNEYQALFKSLFSAKGKHREIIEALMIKSSGLTRKDLSSIPQIGDGKSLTTALEELSECGFIRVYDNYKGSKNGKFFQIIDPFVLFSKTFLLSNKFDSFLSYVNTPSYYSWSGHAFEIVCLNSILNIKKVLGISGVQTREYSWRSKISNPSSQIDLIIQRKDNVINVCEMKYTLGDYKITKEYSEILKNKIQTFVDEVKPREQLILTFITSNSLTNNEYSDIVSIKITSEELFN